MQKPFTVSQYQFYVNELLGVENVWVEGEVSNFKEIPGRNFCYFDIKDDKAVAKCFQGFWHSKKVPFKNGDKIQVLGFSILQKNGSLVIDVKEIWLLGGGEILKKYFALKEKLESEGLFDKKHKKPLPIFAFKIGLIAGKNSSAYHDVTAEIKERWSGKVYFFSTKVQGIYAKGEIINAIKHFNQKQPVDILIIARGGGSAEELQAFDDEEVVREIFASRIPVISAIGHEDHWTLCDFVADERAKTPTKAAQLAVASKDETKAHLKKYFSFLKNALLNKFQNSKQNLSILKRQAVVELNRKIIFYRQQLKNFSFQIQKNIQINLNQARFNLEKFKESLRLLDPKRILAQGFAVVERNGKRIFSAKDFQKKDEFKLVFFDGKIIGSVMETQKNMNQE